MRNSRDAGPGGFTLIELLIVVVIMAILASLIVPMLNKTRSLAKATSCLSRVKAIASAIRSYSAGWNGYTPPDAESFMTQNLGYKLYFEQGYYGEAPGTWYTLNPSTPSESQKYVEKAKDLWCPADFEPRINKHGLPISYSIASAFSGANLSEDTMGDARTVAVAELVRRHPGPGDQEVGHYVYGDLHATLGPEEKAATGFPFAHGLRFRVWHTNSFSGIQGVKESALPKDPAANPPLAYDSIWNSALRSGGAHWASFLDGYSYDVDWNLTYWSAQPDFYGGTDLGMVRFPTTYAMRWDGLIQFPAPGTYQFYAEYIAVAEGGASMALSIGAKGDVLDPTLASYFTTPNDPANPYTKVIGAGDENEFYPIQILYRGSVWCGMWKISWTRRDPAGDVDPNLSGVPVSTENLFFIPQ
ncbi:MAG: type II secretion system protein [Planctomycetes bacterium]|nr:type II secretion system protein [Planctomycetota bacterium]